MIDRIKQLPDGEDEFAYEIDLLGKVSGVMSEATEILARPETGSPAIAAETEAIELLAAVQADQPQGRRRRRRQPWRRRHGHRPTIRPWPCWAAA